ncbi:hypothetical protein SAMN04487943_11228 [Gracilibacillus orientalis]|uniref:YopX protein n=1 Tax=Gracilibacillus orientalis TaxID=334253 RepID=A0A1I4PM07_9BACI|nr:hypothetical protein [Gracilibacillus orientalis]SFM28664.1 hypothetical protein SAMN04487943_11228 [Gracilibacillus orientalis]
MEFPEVYQTSKTDNTTKKTNIYGTDYKGNEVYAGDEIYIYEEEFWLVNATTDDEKELLQFFGAVRVKAESEVKEK